MYKSLLLNSGMRPSVHMAPTQAHPIEKRIMWRRLWYWQLGFYFQLKNTYSSSLCTNPCFSTQERTHLSSWPQPKLKGFLPIRSIQLTKESWEKDHDIDNWASISSWRTQTVGVCVQLLKINILPHSHSWVAVEIHQEQLIHHCGSACCLCSPPCFSYG